MVSLSCIIKLYLKFEYSAPHTVRIALQLQYNEGIIE